MIMCQACEYQMTEDDERNFDGKCPSCKVEIYFCDSCEDYFPISRYEYDAQYCEDCFYNHYSQCEDCGEYFPDEDLVLGLCSECEFQRENEEEE